VTAIGLRIYTNICAHSGLLVINIQTMFMHDFKLAAKVIGTQYTDNTVFIIL
jgi:hypothetical protein